MTVSSHNYAFDAADLLTKCLEQLQDVIDLDRNGQEGALYILQESLLVTENVLQEYFCQLIDNERLEQEAGNTTTEYKEDPSLSTCIIALRHAITRQEEKREDRRTPERDKEDQHHVYYQTRSINDTLLFRLIVALQLSLVRIGDAYNLLRSRRRSHDFQKTYLAYFAKALTIGISGATMAYLSRLPSDQRRKPLMWGASALTLQWISRHWNTIWMSQKVIKSTVDIDRWCHQWNVVQEASTREIPNFSSHSSSSTPDLPQTILVPSKTRVEKCSSDADAAKSKRLIEYALKDTSSTQSSYWLSEGELRFFMVKKFMDVFYACQPSHWQMPTTSLKGGEDLLQVSSNNSAGTRGQMRVLIQNSWGIVSQPSWKNFSLQASRLLKGAAVADRIEIAGVPCFVLSRHACPELATAIHVHRKQRGRRSPLHQKLSTIDEQTECLTPSRAIIPARGFAAGINGSLRQQDVIFHLTGGGFFAHMITFDLPYLLDWSASTGAVIICPEYALLPRHTFPDALTEVTNVYRAVASGGATSDLGFEVDRIVVTGESTGGNLATSLCVNLCLGSPKKGNDMQSFTTFRAEQPPQIRLPDALMLSCPVLNLSLELSHSRVVGTEDPVLPSSVLSAISDAYLPSRLGVPKTNILASPFYAPDDILVRFPPTLLFASSSDPLLDDAVSFNQRLLSLGVESDLRATNNMPHAFWGLATAGFPEAQHVQKECQEWLSHQFTKGHKSSAH